MKLLLAELDKRGWSHEAKMALLWFIEGVMHIADEDVRGYGGQVQRRRTPRRLRNTCVLPPAKVRLAAGRSIPGPGFQQSRSFR
jgi:hypothetical protein